MSILYNKTGVIYTKTRNANQVSSYVEWDTIDCKIEPVQDISDTTFDWMSAFEVFQVFSDNMTIKASDKIIIDSTDYIVKWVKRYDGLRRAYTISFVQKSQWS